MNELDELTIAEERENAYGFLAGLCLKPPSDSLIEQIKDGSILTLFRDDSGLRSYDEMARFVREASDMENISDELAAEHTSIFVLPSSHLPHEAVYLDKEKRLGGRVTISVSQFYEKAGADILESSIDMPDHIGMELEFLGFLCRLERELRKNADHTALNDCIRLQKEFLDEHLLKWAYQCCEKIGEKAIYGFYKAVACLITEFMKDEEGYVTELYASMCSKGEAICEAKIN